MKRLIICLFMVFVTVSAKSQTSSLARGADISWCSEMEADGRKFYNKSGIETDIFALMKEIGMTAIRLRVWVDPEGYGYGAWCDKADVLNKARRAHEQGLDLMIDFHYSDSFTDPGTQTTPASWNGLSLAGLKTALTTHTKDVLQAMKDDGIEPRWVQVGNETNSGMLFDYGKIDFTKSGTARFASYTPLSNVAYDAVKEVFPEAYVIVHLGGTENADWFFTDFKASGGKFDMIGLSHYPTESEWDSTSSSATHSNVNAAKYVKAAGQKFGVPVMICETGYSVNNAAKANEVMTDLFERMGNLSQCAGIFYWEPEVDGVWKPAYYTTVGWGAYGMGAFTTDGRPTVALNSFSGNGATNPFPSSLNIYDRNGTQVLAALSPKDGETGAFVGQLNCTEAWMNFFVVDEESNIWYGTDPSDKTALSSETGKWNFWIDSDVLGVYDIEVNLSTMKWTHSLNESATGIINIVDISSMYTPEWYDIQGRTVSHLSRGLYIIRQGQQKKLMILR